jgi:outer membrane protein with beta-barrel domain
MTNHTLKTTLALCLALLFARAAAAQSPLYIAGAGFSDIKLFGTGTIYYPVSNAPTLNSTGAGGGLRVGTFLHPRLSLEFGVDAGSKSETSFGYPVQILAIYPAPSVRLKASARFVTVNTVLGYHPAPLGRVRFGFLGGFSIVSGTYTSDLPGYVFPATTFSETRSIVTPVLGFTSLPSLGLFAPPRSYTQHDIAAGGLLGFEAAFEVTKRLAVVPEVRSVIFSQPFNGPGVFLVRPGVHVRWGF